MGESPLLFLSRAYLIRHERQQFGFVRSDLDANRYYVCRLLSDFEIRQGMLLAISEINTATLEQAIKTAYDDLELSGSRSGTLSSHAFAATASGASDRVASVGRRNNGRGKGRSHADSCGTNNHDHYHYHNKHSGPRPNHNSHHQHRDCCYRP